MKMPKLSLQLFNVVSLQQLHMIKSLRGLNWAYTWVLWEIIQWLSRKECFHAHNCLWTQESRGVLMCTKPILRKHVKVTKQAVILYVFFCSKKVEDLTVVRQEHRDEATVWWVELSDLNVLSLIEHLEGNSTAKSSLKIRFEARQVQSRSEAQLFFLSRVLLKKIFHLCNHG